MKNKWKLAEGDVVRKETFGNGEEHKRGSDDCGAEGEARLRKSTQRQWRIDRMSLYCCSTMN